MCFQELCCKLAKCKCWQKIFTFRGLFILALLACLSLLLGSHIVETYFYIIPCQLCILQRGVYYVLAALFMIGALHNPTNVGRYTYAMLNFIFSAIGITIAGRQIWIQHLPIEQVPECAPGLERLLSIYPFLDVIKMVFHGTSECFKVHFKVLGLPLSNWSFLSFIGFASLCVLIMIWQKKRWI